MNKVELSIRLQAIADMVSPGAFVCDVGCDHGFLPIRLIQDGSAAGALAMDIGEGPLQAAKEHIEEAGLGDVIQTRISDGLHGVTRKEIRSFSRENRKLGAHVTLVIAGMGGPLILKILSECPRVRDVFDEIIISPQSQIDEVRKFLKPQRLDIIDETMVIDGGKYYTIMKLKPHSQMDRAGRKQLLDRNNRLMNQMENMLEMVSEGRGRTVATNSQMDLFDAVLYHYGPVLLDEKHDVLNSFLQYEKDILEEIIDQLDSNIHGTRYMEVREQIKLNDYATRLINVCD